MGNVSFLVICLVISGAIDAWEIMLRLTLFLGSFVLLAGLVAGVLFVLLVFLLALLGI